MMQNNDLLTAKIFDKNKIFVKFKCKDKKKFDFIKETIKTLKNRKWDNDQKVWVLSNNSENIYVLKSLDFEIKEITKIDNIKLKITSNLVFINTTNDGLLLLQQHFSYNDYSNCYNNGIFNANKIKKICLLKIQKNIGILPIGLLHILYTYIKDNNIHHNEIYTHDYSLNIVSELEIKNNLHYLSLYDYQIDCIEHIMKHRNGIIKLPTSAGKTEIFLSLCNLTKLKTLVLFNRIDIAKQTLTRAKQANLDAGIVQGTNIDENHTIVMCTIQSSHKLQNNYEMVIVDECHRALGKQYDQLLRKRSFKFRFGFSATPFQKDIFKTILVKKWLGDIIYTLPANVLIEKKKIAKPTIFFSSVSGNRVTQQLHTWHDIEKFCIINNEKRNNKIINICANINEPTLILVKKIEHGQILEKQIENSIFLHGKIDTDIREKYMTMFENNEKITLIASTIFDEGISLNNIRCLIIAGGGKSEQKTIQRIGRGLRIKEDKKTVEVYDFYDTSNPIVLRQSDERISTYKNEGFTDIKFI